MRIALLPDASSTASVEELTPIVASWETSQEVESGAMLQLLPHAHHKNFCTDDTFAFGCTWGKSNNLTLPQHSSLLLPLSLSLSLSFFAVQQFVSVCSMHLECPPPMGAFLVALFPTVLFGVFCSKASLFIFVSLTSSSNSTFFIYIILLILECLQVFLQ